MAHLLPPSYSRCQRKGSFLFRFDEGFETAEGVGRRREGVERGLVFCESLFTCLWLFGVDRISLFEANLVLGGFGASEFWVICWVLDLVVLTFS